MSAIKPDNPVQAQQPVDLAAAPSVQQAAPATALKTIAQDNLNDVHHMPRGKIPDDFLAEKIKDLTGQTFDKTFAAKDGFRISCGFQPKVTEADHRDMFTFVRNGQEYFGVKRYVTVEWKEKGLEQRAAIAYNIELGLKVPQEGDFKSKKAFNDAMDQAMYMAGISGKMAAEPWELMVKDRVGLATQDPKWAQFKDHINKIREDRFVTLELIHNAKSIKLGEADSFKTRHITEVKLHVRGGKSIATREGDTEDPKLHLSSFQTDSYKAYDQRGRIYGDKFKRRNWHLSQVPLYSDQKEVSASIKHYANAQNLDAIRDATTTGDKALKDVLQEKDLTPQMLQGTIKSQNERLQNDLNSYLYMLSDGKGLQSLVNKFADKPVPNFKDNKFINDEFKTGEKTPPQTLLEKLESKLPQKTEKPKNILETLSKLEALSNLSPDQARELNIIRECSRKAIQEMKIVHNEMSENEKLLKQTVNDESLKKIEQNAGVRSNTIREFVDLFSGFYHTELPLVRPNEPENLTTKTTKSLPDLPQTEPKKTKKQLPQTPNKTDDDS